MTNLISELKNRGTLKAVTDEALEKKLNSEPMTVYCGFDPTADSLHIGNLVSLMALRRFQLTGHRVIAVVGGATGMIGDPSGRDDERRLLSQEELDRNIRGVTTDISRVLDTDGPNPATVLNNSQWLEGITMIQFLRDIGKHFRVNAMIQKDSVKDRLAREEGISFTEFTYSLLQAFDFLSLFDNEGCQLQIGGSDQWGNITAGIELIRRVRQKEAFGLTLNLLLDGNGAKFGKSTGGGSLWLSPVKTSPYHLYQNFINSADDGDLAEQEVARYLRIFTLLSLSEIDELMTQHNECKGKRIAQKRLAEEVVRSLHGEEGLKLAHEATEALFANKSVADMSDIVLNTIAIQLPTSQLENGFSIVEAVLEAGLKNTKGEVRRLIKQNGVTLNHERVTTDQQKLTASDLDNRNACLLAVGKKNRAVIRFLD